MPSTEFEETAKDTRGARRLVADQLHAALTEGEFMGGGKGEVAMRLRQVAVAEKRGDAMALRAAAVEAATAFGAWAARIDAGLSR